MKFGKQLEFYKIPEWSEYYLDYNGIKTVIKFLDKRRLKKKQLKKIKTIKAQLRALSAQSEDLPSIEEENNTNENNPIKPDENSEKLLIPDKKQLHRNQSLAISPKTEKIMEAEDLSGFSSDEKKRRFINIYKGKIRVVNEFFSKKLEEFVENLDKLKRKMHAKNQKLTKEESNYQRTTKQLNAERDEMGYAVSWKRALSSLFNETSWLHSYHSINILAIKKIQKKNYQNF